MQTSVGTEHPYTGTSVTPAELAAYVAIFTPAYPAPRPVYVAVMDLRDTAGDYQLEVEVSGDTIALVIPTSARVLVAARQVADALDALLSAAGYEVVRTRDAWERVLEPTP